MAKLTVPIPSFLQGVSQQAAQIRLATQADLQDNAYPSLTDGLMKRHPVDHIRRLDEDDVGDAFVHLIDRDPTEQYVALFRNASEITETWTLQITAVGTTGQTWHVALLSQTANYTVQGGDTAHSVAVGLAAAIAALTGVSAGETSSGIVTIIADAPGVTFTPVVTPAATGTYVLTRTTPHAVRVFEASDGSEIDVFGSEGAIPDFATYLSLGSDPANRSLRAVTIADYTLLLNRLVATQLSANFTNSDPSNVDGFLFVRAGEYSTTYKVTLRKDATTYTVQVRTWDGIAQAAGIKEQWKLTIAAAGTVGQTWRVSILGNTAAYTVQGGDVTTNVATGLKNAIDALSSVSATVNGNAVTITADGYGTHFTPAVVEASGGAYSLELVARGEAQDDLTSVDAHDIAQALADHINAISGSPFATEVDGPVVHVSVGSGTIVEMLADDGRSGEAFLKVHKAVPAIDQLPVISIDGFTVKIDGGTVDPDDDYYVTFHLDAPAVAEVWTFQITAPGHSSKKWHVRVLGNTVDYAVQSGDTAADVATQLKILIDALSGVSATVSGDTITITAGVAGVSLNPAITPAKSGTYILTKTSEAIGDFGRGKWLEGVGPDVAVGLDANTMPWRLVRMQDDADGTITGTPNAKWFLWDAVEWDDRAGGDETSAPSPSLAVNGTAISDIFFHRNRLGLIGGQNVVMSEAGRFFNLFRTTVLSVPDSDPIDILVPSEAVVHLNHAVPMAKTLVLFSDEAEYVLEGDPILTPQTVQVLPATNYLVGRSAHPLSDGEGVFFPVSKGDFAGVRKLYPTGNVQDQFDADDITIAVPQYLSGEMIQMSARETEGLLLVLADGDQSILYLNKTHTEQNQRLQAAWCRYTFGAQNRIVGHGFIGQDLYLVVKRADGVHLERSRIQSDAFDEGADYLTHLDRRVQKDTGTYDGMADTTTWTLSYTPDVTEEYVAVTRSSTGLDGGTVIPLALDGDDVVADGDFSAVEVWIGQTFELRYRFSKLYLKATSPTGSQTVKISGRLQMLHGILSVENTSTLKVEVTPSFRSLRTTNLDGATLDDIISDVLTLGTGELRFPIFAKDAVIEIVSGGPLPCNMQAAEFECDVTVRGGFQPYRP